MSELNTKPKMEIRTLPPMLFEESLEEAEKLGYHVAGYAWLPSPPKIVLTPDSDVKQILQEVADKPLYEYYDEDKEEAFNPHLARRERLSRARSKKASFMAALKIYKSMIDKFGEENLVLALGGFDGEILHFWVRPEHQPTKKSYKDLQDNYNMAYGSEMLGLGAPTRIFKKDVISDIDEAKLNEILDRPAVVGEMATSVTAVLPPISDN